MTLDGRVGELWKERVRKRCLAVACRTGERHKHLGPENQLRASEGASVVIK